MAQPRQLTGFPQWRLVCAFAIAFATLLRIAVAWTARVTTTSDTPFYLAQARDLLAGRWSPFFPVGYPLMIAALLPASDAHVEAALLAVNVVLSAATVLIVADAARQVGSWRAAAIAAAVIGLWPNQLNYVRLIMSDAAGAFFVAASIGCAARGRDAAAGAAAAGAALIRTVCLPLVPLGAALLARDRMTRGVRFAAAALVPLALVAALSFALSGGVAIGGNFGFNLDVARRSIGSRIEFGSDSPSTREAARRYLAAAAAEPRHFLAQRALALWELWGPWPGGDEPRARTQLPRSAAARAVIGLRSLLLLAAMPTLARLRRDTTIAYLWLVVATITAVHAMTFSTPRFTIAAEPALAVLAALSLDDWMRRGLVRKGGLEPP
jgi:hypothetical protein